MLIINPDEIPAFFSVDLSANVTGIQARTKQGKPAYLAIVDESLGVLEAGPDVEKAVWLLMLLARRNFLEGKGHVRVHRPA
ncbi:MAG: hypothetical protein ACJ72N_07515 [Labedaea sp.]|jgi:hypothetical protein